MKRDAGRRPTRADRARRAAPTPCSATTVQIVSGQNGSRSRKPRRSPGVAEHRGGDDRPDDELRRVGGERHRPDRAQRQHDPGERTSGTRAGTAPITASAKPPEPITSSRPLECGVGGPHRAPERSTPARHPLRRRSRRPARSPTTASAAPAPSSHSWTRMRRMPGTGDRQAGDDERDPDRERVVPADHAADRSPPAACVQNGSASSSTWTNGMTTASAAGEDEAARARRARRAAARAGTGSRTPAGSRRPARRSR